MGDKRTEVPVSGDRLKVIGDVVEGAKEVPIGRDRGCCLSIRINQGEVFDILIVKGQKPWNVPLGARIGAVGVLRSGTVQADDWWRCNPATKPELTILG